MDALEKVVLCESRTNLAPKRHWSAQIDLTFGVKRGKTRLVHSAHHGPLRLLKNFHPEVDGTSHSYLIHPPGGMAPGDQIDISVALERNAKTLITTPSAGKVYGIKNVKETFDVSAQTQNVQLTAAADACLEWLPQETIIFDSAQVDLNTRVELSRSAKFFGWDTIMLGRNASGEKFQTGACTQKIELFVDGKLLLLEKNRLDTASTLLTKRWGLAGNSILATALATTSVSRAKIDQLYEQLNHDLMQWSLTQLGDIFIARYMGNSILECKAGLLVLWQEIRPLLTGKKCIKPRIWYT